MGFIIPLIMKNCFFSSSFCKKYYSNPCNYFYFFWKTNLTAYMCWATDFFLLLFSSQCVIHLFYWFASVFSLKQKKAFHNKSNILMSLIANYLPEINVHSWKLPTILSLKKNELFYWSPPPIYQTAWWKNAIFSNSQTIKVNNDITFKCHSCTSSFFWLDLTFSFHVFNHNFLP